MCSNAVHEVAPLGEWLLPTPDVIFACPILAFRGAGFGLGWLRKTSDTRAPLVPERLARLPYEYEIRRANLGSTD
jgi:hypothetical protein